MTKNIMNADESKTWAVLQELKIDDIGSQFKFSDRLARENNWSKEFALALVEEYKKFVFLAKHAGHPVTPSLEVDEAWHLHMIYTRSYWDDMCESIAFKLHHGPTKGGKAEDVKFTNWYEKTKDSYRKFFDEPAAQFWPSSAIRFAPNNVVKVDKNKNFVVRKPKLQLSFAGVFAFLITALTLTGCQSEKGSEFTNGELWFIGIGCFVVLWIIIALIVRSIRNSSKSSYDSKTSCSSESGGSWIFFSCGSSGCDSSSSSSHSSCSSSSSSCSSSSSSCSSSSCGSSCGGGCGS